MIKVLTLHTTESTMNKKRLEFSVVILEDKTGGYIALVLELPGCHTQGDTLEEVMSNIKEAIELYLETLTPEEREELLARKVVGVRRVKVVA